MVTTEEKLNVLSAQMKSMLLLMESFNRWRPEVDHSSTELTMEIKTLTSHVEALETNHAPPSAPKREEEGQAKGHGVESTTQGLDKEALVLKPPLANGQYTGSPSHPIDMGDSTLYYHTHTHALPLSEGD